jgi:peptide/nickel transport system ATP-binding protein
MSDVILDLRDISRRYIMRQGFWGHLVPIRAVDGVSLKVEQGKTLGLVGESGSGKSTTGRLALGMEDPDGGSVHFRGQPLPPAGTSRWRRMRADMQMIFQDPLGALNRQLPILEQVREPLDIHRISTPPERTDKALAMLNAVGLSADLGQRFPHELSGGQRQRAVLARALVTNPDLLVCDEPVSALDVSIQAQVVNLLTSLQEEFGLSLLFISHDLKVVRHVSHHMAVMYLGQIVESGDTDLLLSAPAHPYTEALVSAAPVPGKRARRRIVLTGEPPNPAARPSGCAFHPRCPVARPQCKTESPALRQKADGRFVACHFAQEQTGCSGGLS